MLMLQCTAMTLMVKLERKDNMLLTQGASNKASKATEVTWVNNKLSVQASCRLYVPAV